MRAMHLLRSANPIAKTKKLNSDKDKRAHSMKIISLITSLISIGLYNLTFSMHPEILNWPKYKVEFESAIDQKIFEKAEWMVAQIPQLGFDYWQNYLKLNLNSLTETDLERFSKKKLRSLIDILRKSIILIESLSSVVNSRLQKAFTEIITVKDKFLFVGVFFFGYYYFVLSCLFSYVFFFRKK